MDGITNERERESLLNIHDSFLVVKIKYIQNLKEKRKNSIKWATKKDDTKKHGFWSAVKLAERMYVSKSIQNVELFECVFLCKHKTTKSDNLPQVTNGVNAH